MQPYGQFCPIAQALEVLGERWTLLIVRELLCGCTRFSELERMLPLMSKAVLTDRLQTLAEHGLVQRHQEPGRRKVTWELTPAGHALEPFVMGLGEWAQVWLQRPLTDDTLDPDVLMWDIRRNVSTDDFGPPPAAAKFHFVDGPQGPRTYWLVHREDVEHGMDVCLSSPGQDIGATIHAELRALTEVWVGHVTLEDAIAAGRIRVEGGELARSFSAWIGLSPLAPAALQAR